MADFIFERRIARAALVSLVAASSACGGATRVDATRGEPPPTESSGHDVLAVVAGGELRFFTTDGAASTVLAGGSLTGISGVDLVGGARYVLVRAYASSTPSSGLRLALVGADGSSKWERSFAVSFNGGSGDNALAWGVGVGEDGSVVLHDRNTSDFHVESARGGSLAGFSPVGRAVDGMLPVRSAWSAGQPYAVTYGWWRIGGELMSTTRFDATTGFDAQESVAFSGKMLRLRRDGVVLVVEGATASDVIGLPQATDAARIGPLAGDEMFAADERWLLVASGTTNRVIRVDLQTKTATAVDLVAPDGYRAFSNCRDDAPIDGDLRIDRDGRIVRALRTDDRVAAFATTDGAHWTQIGGSFSDVGGFSVRLSRGTAILRGHRGVYCYTTGPTWTSPSTADFAGDWTEIVRGDAHVASQDPAATSYVLSRTGRYGARWQIDPSTRVASLHIADLATGAEKIVAVDGDSVRSTQPVWLWGP